MSDYVNWLRDQFANYSGALNGTIGEDVVKRYGYKPKADLETQNPQELPTLNGKPTQKGISENPRDPNLVNKSYGGYNEVAGDFKAISGLVDFKSKVPSGAQELLWKNIDGGAAEGVKYRWTDAEGNVWNVRAHSIDPSAPLGSNASKGWVYRVEVRWGGTGKKYFMDSSGNFHPENVIRPNSPMYNEAIANDTHIVFGNR